MTLLIAVLIIKVNLFGKDLTFNLAGETNTFYFHNREEPIPICTL